MENVEVEIGDLVYDFAAVTWGIVVSPPAEPPSPYFIADLDNDKYVWIFWFSPRDLFPIHKISFEKGYVEVISR